MYINLIFITTQWFSLVSVRTRIMNVRGSDVFKGSAGQRMFGPGVTATNLWYGLLPPYGLQPEIA
jgi:hypothetical protein